MIKMKHILIIEKTFPERTYHFFGNPKDMSVFELENKIFSWMNAQLECQIFWPVFQFFENGTVTLQFIGEFSCHYDMNFIAFLNRPVSLISERSDVGCVISALFMEQTNSKKQNNAISA
jgi:hypothetical protein